MSNEPNGNPHVYNAIHAIGEANHPSLVWENGDTERIALQIEANTRATLALAYEQRTANLIAYATSIDDTDAAVFAQIKERLDRPEPPTPEPVQHFRVGPARCNCGYDAYKINGIMIDYAEEFAAHLRRNR